MSFLTSPSVLKGQPTSFTLDKELLALIPKVELDLFFKQPSNWKRVTVQFKNAQGQEEVLVFNPSDAVPTATFSVTENARSDYQITRVIIQDHDNGVFPLVRSDLSAQILAGLDVSFQAVVVPPEVVEPPAPIVGPIVLAETTPGMTPYHVRLSWNTPVGLTGAVTYDVYRGTTLIATTDNTTYLDFAAVQGTSYQYKVIARTATQTTLPGIANFVAPAAPQSPGPTVVAFASPPDMQPYNVSISWTPLPLMGEVTYDLYRDSILIHTTIGTSYMDFNAIQGMPHEYKVIARTATETTLPGIYILSNF